MTTSVILPSSPALTQIFPSTTQRVIIDMPQHRLEHWFTPSRALFIPSGLSFLDLPYSVRSLVYRYAGLDDQLVDLNYSNLKVYQRGKYPETDDCRKLDLGDWSPLRKVDVAARDEVWEIDDDGVVQEYGRDVWGNGWGVYQSMLLVSRQLHQEVEAFTCARAVFRVCLGQPMKFTRLWRMSDHALSNLGSLTIRLDAPKNVVDGNGWGETASPPTYLGFSTMLGKSIVKTWVATVDHLARTLRPGQLRLRVIFCAKTLGDARAIVVPMARLPRLKDCGICVELQGQTCWWKPNTVGYTFLSLLSRCCTVI